MVDGVDPFEEKKLNKDFFFSHIYNFILQIFKGPITSDRSGRRNIDTVKYNVEICRENSKTLS